jgi:crotonobetainyl-CoA:carnitine CoA-transferase CaiB-like acyl-CoA transferase
MTEPSGPTLSPPALDGVRVLDLSQVMAGPFCTMVLADLGADVVKIENPHLGDQMRRSWGYSVVGEDSRAFLSLNRNKRSVALDLKSDADYSKFRELARDADVVIENFRPGVAKRLGVDYETLVADNPGLIYASITGFGQDGPYSQYPGYDLIAQAMTGVMSVMGEEGRPPIKSAIPVADLGSGMFSAIGILAALRARDRDGVGQRVETSLFESALALSIWESTEFWSTGESPKPLGSANRMSAPYQAFSTADGHLTLGANNEKLWRLTADAIGAPELLEDPRFVDNNARMAHRTELADALQAIFVTRTTDEWVELLLNAGVPAGPIRDYAYVLEEDAHVKARQMVSTVEHPVEGTINVLSSPLRLSRTPPTIRTAPPLLGADSDHVLTKGWGNGAQPSPSA